MGKKFIKLVKITASVCMIIFIIELVYIYFLNQGKSIYFDGINSVISLDTGYIAVGSNNNNDKYFEKAKITKYNSKKEKSFEKVYNKGYNGVFFDIVEDAGNFVVVGDYEKDEEEHENGLRTALIVKYDKDGNLIYENDFQMLGNSKFTSVNVVEDGYIVTGQSVYENMTVGLSEEGGAFVVKYSKALEVEWKRNFGDSKTAVYNDLVVVDDYIYAVGMKDSIVGIIAKYDMDGSLIKSTNYEYTDSLGFTGIVYLNDKLFVSTGKRNGDVEGVDFDAAIVQYDLELNLKKEAIYVGDGFERYNQIISDYNDNIVVIGTTALIDDKKFSQGINVFNHNGLIAKYDKNLEKISVIHYGDERDDYFTDVIVSDGNYLVSGYSSYEDGSYLSKFITYSDALKILEVE